ncbi:BREX system P-loop protein BrxC [Sphingobacterium multivorum]|uniref:BREX system P-loop protein BrxC n=1 Tax=Sphingobacterium multivorum TaxID=28454 RepID=UPI0028AE8432|nr:BREX system P-loop protein BrxC [Sphingobacterium multivorum]
MILKEIYEKDITRHINPAVVVSELGNDNVEQEISEYVFTKDIVQNIYKFLNAISHKREGKTGVWVSGYYGSGKSHFIKYLFYCLNKQTRQLAFERYKKSLQDIQLDDLSEVTLSNVQLIQNNLDKTTIDEIIFNVDAVSGTIKNNNTITRILFNQLNACRGYNTLNIAVALLIEKHLDDLGLFEQFKTKIKAVLNEEWNNSKIRHTIERHLSKVLDVAIELDPNLDKASLTTAIKSDSNYRIDEFIEELKAHVEAQDANYKLIFLMDEVSQYIGANTDLLLNLQTIVEEIGSKIGNKVWIVCTAQQDLRNLINNTEKKSEDFGKIMGRFETMISLDSQDVAYITQKRILEKNEEGLKALVPFYKENKGAIENQFIFDHDLYNNYKSADEFYLAYPFVPYQFRLISDVFHSFSTVGYVGEGVKNTERAILGITHYTADKQKNNELGYFISFDNFFNDQFSKNLTHAANSILNKALQISFSDAEEKVIADRVIKVLFMISNLSEDTSVNLPATVENLTLLLLNDVREVKMKIQERIQRVLDTLVDKNIIQVSEGKYKFLDDEGIKVANAIADAEVISNTRLEYFYKRIIKKILNPEPAINLGNRTVKVELSIDDKIMDNGDAFNIRFMVFDGADINQQALQMATKELCININYWFHQQTDFKKDFFTYCKTAKYLEDNKANASGTRAKTLDEFASRNEILLKDLIIRFEKLFATTPFISNQNVVDATEVSSANPAQRFNDMVDYHVKALYKNHSWSNSFAQSNNDLQSAIQVALKSPAMNFELNIAETEVNNRISILGDEASVAHLVKEFEKAPYGWRDLTTLHILFNLAHKKYRQIEYQNEVIDLKDYYSKAINSRDREATLVKKLKSYNQEEVASFKQAVKDIFISISFASTNQEVADLVKQFKDGLSLLLTESHQYKEEYLGYPFVKHINSFYKELRDVYETRSEEKLMRLVFEKQKELKTYRDLYMQTKDFIDSNFESYKEMRDYVLDNKHNIEKIDAEGDLQGLLQYFSTDDQPGEQFPIIRKTNRKIKQALEKYVAELKQSVLAQYEEIFEELRLKQEELELEESQLTTDKSFKLAQIEKLKQINDLEIQELKASEFRLDNLKRLQDAAAKKHAADKGESYQPKTIQTVNISASIIAGNTIDSPEQVDALLEKLRNKLMVELGKNGKIFLT